MIKEYFTDGLLQVAIVLSLLRTDINSYLNTAYYSRTRPELQEILLGSLTGYTQTDFHTQNHWNDVYGGYAHPKGIRDHDVNLIFRDLHSLSRYRRFDGINTNINTWLVSNLDAAEGDNSLTDAVSNAINNPNETSDVQAVAETVSAATGNNDDLDHTEYFGSELTKEDMDLIDVLWSQDMDLGVGREMFDASLRTLEVNKESEDLQSKKSQTTLNASVEDQGANVNLSADYIIDGETGELIALTPDLLPAEPLLDQLIQVTTPELFLGPSDDTQGGFYNLFTDAHTDTLHAADSQVAPLARQTSIEERWWDVCSLLDMAPTADNDTAYGALDMTPTVDNGSEMDGVNESYGSVLLQNVTMANPLDNNTTAQHMSFVSALDMALPPSQSVVNMTSPMEVPSNDSLTWNLMELLGLNDVTNVSSIPDAMAYAGPNAPSNATLRESNATSLASYLNAESILEELLNSNYSVADINFDDIIADVPNTGGDYRQRFDNWPTDSAVSSWQPYSGYSSYESPVEGAAVYDGLESAAVYDGVEGATGGSDDSTAPSKCSESFDTTYDDSYTPISCSSSSDNSSWPSNSTTYQPLDVSKKNVVHNHSYPIQRGQRSRDEEKAEMKREKQERAMRSRDEKKAKALKLPISVEEIVSTPVDEFTELLTKYHLNDMQHQLIRDIRRRGKNKQAAQNCRKRKMEVIQTLEDEVDALRRTRDLLAAERHNMERESSRFKEKYNDLERQLFDTLRDPMGRRYNRDDFSLIQSNDGNFFIVPRDATTPGRSSSQQAHPDKQSRKRKPKRKD